MRTNVDFADAGILVIDDSPDNLTVVRQLLTLIGYRNVTTLQEPAEALALIASDPPDLILLDLLMPGVSGFDILSRLGEVIPSTEFRPVLIFTAECTADAKVRALGLGASDFIAKPFDAAELILRVRNFLRMRMMHVQLNDSKVFLESVVQERTQDLVLSRLETLDCLARAGEFRDDATGEHTKRVAALSARLAKAVGLDAEAVELIREAAPLHDLGKIGVPDAILLKPGKLTDPEFEMIKEHSILGASILGRCSSPILRQAREIALHHHEHWDGTGYPDGLEGTQIPLSCRVVAVADMYDALTHLRPYKVAWSHGKAVTEIQRVSGLQLDPEIVEAFLGLETPDTSHETITLASADEHRSPLTV